MRSEAMAVRVISLDEEFSALESAWEELFASNPAHRPYQSWQWNYAWWKHHGKAGDLRLIMLKADGHLVGIAPLFLAKRLHGIPLRHLRMIGHRRADYQDVVVRPGFEAVFFQELFEHLIADRGRWHFLEIRDLPELSANMPWIMRESRRIFPSVQQDPGEECATLLLPATFDEFLNGLSKRFRKDIAYCRRLLERHFTVEFRAISGADQTSAALADLATVYRARWLEEKGSMTPFDNPQSAGFEQEVCEQLSRAGLYQLYLLYADQKPAAGILAYVHNGRCYVERFAHSPEFHKYSAGTILLSLAIEDAIGKRFTEFDLMRGAEAYKFRWNGQSRRNFRVRIFRDRHIAGWVGFLDRTYVRASKNKTLLKLHALAQRSISFAPKRWW